MQDTTAKAHISNPPFGQRVYNVLKLSEDHRQQHIISWMNNGTAFKVHDVEAFERGLLRKCLNTKKYSSFTRTLCAHGFTCVRAGRATGIYSHPNFRRNEPQDLTLIKRVKNNKNTASKEGSVLNSQHSAEQYTALKNHLLSNLNYGIRDERRTVPFAPLLDHTGPTLAQQDLFQKQDDFEPIPWSPSQEHSSEIPLLIVTKTRSQEAGFQAEDLEPKPFSPQRYSPLQLGAASFRNMLAQRAEADRSEKHQENITSWMNNRTDMVVQNLKEFE